MKRILLISCLALAGYQSEARQITLKQALELAQQHSHVLKQSEAAAAAASESFRSAHAEKWPTVSLVGLSSYIDDVPSLTIELPTGDSFSRYVGSKANYQFDTRVALPLYAGGRISAHRNAAQAVLDYRRALERADLDRICHQTRAEYFRLIQADRLIETAEASLRRTQIISTDVDAMFTAGVADSIDILEARLAVTRATFVRDQALSNRRALEISLSTLLGLDLSEPVIPTTDLPPPSPPELLRLVTESKPEFLAVETTIRLKQSQVKLTAAEYLPGLSAYAGYSYGKPNLDRFNGTWNDYVTAGARLDWSFNLGRQSLFERSAARYNLAAATHQKEQVREQVGRDAALAHEQLQLAYKKYLSAADEHRSTSDTYRLATEKHKAGSLPTNRLLEIETTLSAAQSRLAAALVDFYIAQSLYLYAVGSDKLKEGI